MKATDPVHDLADLRRAWGSAYRITRDSGQYRATHITSGQALTAGNANDLRKLITDHHTRHLTGTIFPSSNAAPTTTLAANGPATRSQDKVLHSPAAAAYASEQISRLQALATELAARGWIARVDAQPCLSRLHTRNPEPGAGALSEHIYTQPRGDGTWAYWWPWADLIATTAADAAAIIVRVLRTADKP